jgi:hypothetical protein
MRGGMVVAVAAWRGHCTGVRAPSHYEKEKSGCFVTLIGQNIWLIYRKIRIFVISS